MEKSKLTLSKENLTKQFDQLSKEIQEKQAQLLMVKGALELNDYYLSEVSAAETVTAEVIEETAKVEESVKTE